MKNTEIEEIFLRTYFLSLPKAFNQLFHICTDMHVQQNNLAKLFKEASWNADKTLSDENTICFLTYCWMFNTDFFSCPTILRIRALFPIILQVLHLLSLLFRQISSLRVSIIFKMVYFGQLWKMMVGGHFQVIQWCYEKLNRDYQGNRIQPRLSWTKEGCLWQISKTLREISKIERGPG